MQAQDPSEMSGAAVAIDRGNCTFLQKGIYAQDSGAKEVIIVSNDTLVSPHESLPSYILPWLKAKIMKKKMCKIKIENAMFFFYWFTASAVYGQN